MPNNYLLPRRKSWKRKEISLCTRRRKFSWDDFPRGCSSPELVLSWNLSTCYTPDFFFILFYMTLFLFTGVLSIFFTFYLFLNERKALQGGIFLVTIVTSGIFEYFSSDGSELCLPNLRISGFPRFIFSILGLSAVLNCLRACAEVSVHSKKISSKRLRCFTFPFFKSQSDSFPAIKIHCLVSSAFKNLPQLFILSVLLLERNLDKVSAFAGVTLIMLNMTVFSLTVAITFPIRCTPRVFTSSICIVFSAFNKFMATMSSCGVVLTIFATMYKSIHFYALLVPFCRCVTWGWPCWRALRCKAVSLNQICFYVYFIFLSFFSSFIYIHPFEGIGKLYYYVFYLFDFLEEILVIYIFADVSLDSVTGYFSFRVVMIGFLSSFGLINILHKYKDEKIRYGCVSYTSVTSEMPKGEHSTFGKEKETKFDGKSATSVNTPKQESVLKVTNFPDEENGKKLQSNIKLKD